MGLQSITLDGSGHSCTTNLYTKEVVKLTIKQPFFPPKISLLPGQNSVDVPHIYQESDKETLITHTYMGGGGAPA